MLIPIDEVVFLKDPLTHDPTTGAVSDADSAPTFDVFEEDTDTPILAAQTMTKRTSKTGDYRGSFTASAANGFEAGKWYNVVVTAIVGGVTAKANQMHFRVAPAETSPGVPEVRASAIANGAIAAATFAANALDAVWSTATRVLTAGTNLPTESTIADQVWDELTSGHTTSGSYGDKLGAHIKTVLKVIIGTGSTATDVVLNPSTGIDGAAPSSTNDFYNGRVIVFTSGALAGQATDITDYDGGTTTLTVTALTSGPSAAVTAVIV